MTDWSCWRNRPLASLAAKPRTAVLIRRSARAISASGRPPSRRRGDGRPGQQQREDGRVAAGGIPDPVGQRGQPLVPLALGPRQRILGQQHLDQPVEQGVLVIHVPVQRHRRNLQAPGHRVHGDRVQALLVGQPQRGGQHRLAADLRRTSHDLHPSSGSCQDKYITYAYIIY
jgi:hypothetical protein